MKNLQTGNLKTGIYRNFYKSQFKDDLHVPYLYSPIVWLLIYLLSFEYFSYDHVYCLSLSTSMWKVLMDESKSPFKAIKPIPKCSLIVKIEALNNGFIILYLY